MSQSNRAAADVERPLPRDHNAELAVLGAILQNDCVPNETLAKVQEKVNAEDFYDDRHRVIYAAMCAMAARTDSQLDIVELSNFLRKEGKLESAGGGAYISGLDRGVSKRLNVEHLRIIKEKSLLRQLIYKCESIKQAAFDEEYDASAILNRASVDLASISVNGSGGGGLFDTCEEFENTPEPTFSIKDFLQDYCVTAIAALSGHGKTWVSLNITGALLFGPGLLWDLFQVTDRAEKIIYLIPEASRATFKMRLKRMNLYDEVDKRLFVRTLTKGAALPLTDPHLLREVKGAHVICDTAIRFMKAVDENSASEAAQGLSDDFFAMQRAEAKTIIPLFHSPKSFLNQKVMSLEGMIRGSSEFGAVLATAWGIRQIDRERNVVHVENIKPRDFDPCGPFQLIGRPSIDQEGTFRMHRRPGDCSKLAEYLDDVTGRKSSGAPPEARQERVRRVEMVREWLAEGPKTADQLIELFKKAGITVSESAVKNYRKATEDRGGE